MLGPTHDIFQKHNGVIDKKTNGESQRHQSEIIDGEVEHVHHGYGEQQRHRQGHSRDQRVGSATEKDVDHDNHQHERDH